jgi:hypothetical protein
VDTPMVDKDRQRDGTADSSAYLTTATPYDRNTAQKLHRVGAAWAVSSQDSSAADDPCRGLATAATRPSKATPRRPAGASVHCCPQTITGRA